MAMTNFRAADMGGEPEPATPEVSSEAKEPKAPARTTKKPKAAAPVAKSAAKQDATPAPEATTQSADTQGDGTDSTKE